MARGDQLLPYKWLQHCDWSCFAETYPTQCSYGGLGLIITVVSKEMKTVLCIDEIGA